MKRLIPEMTPRNVLSHGSAARGGCMKPPHGAIRRFSYIKPSHAAQVGRRYRRPSTPNAVDLPNGLAEIDFERFGIGGQCFEDARRVFARAERRGSPSGKITEGCIARHVAPECVRVR